MNRKEYQQKVENIAREAIERSEMKDLFAEDLVVEQAERDICVSGTTSALMLLRYADTPNGYYEMHGEPLEEHTKDYDTLIRKLAIGALTFDALGKLDDIRRKARGGFKKTGVEVKEALTDLGFVFQKANGSSRIYKKPGLKGWQVVLHDQTSYKRYTIEQYSNWQARWIIKHMVETPINESTKLQFLSKLYKVLEQELGS